jgi:hypothetical protein
MAAFIAWKLIVNSAITEAIIPAIIKIHQGILIRYAKSCNHLCMKYQATGKAIMAAISTSFKKSFERSVTIVLTSAPKTFLIPISFIRWVMANAERPNRPRQAMKIAMHAKMVKIFPCLCSAW